MRMLPKFLCWNSHVYILSSVFSLPFSDLRRELVEGELLQPLLFVSFVFISVMLYYMVSLMDPGYVEHDEDEKELVSKEQDTVVSQHVPAVQLRRCGYCMLKVSILHVGLLLLLGSHLYLISCNTTTWEFMSRHRISYLKQCEVENPFDQGLFLNLWRFFCACRLVKWENLYPQEESSAA
ncbi:hypothetical protein JD844_004629 [Phrynosoma platyrhinos]|uniref:protein S-acyltransferase n=1 Tax=Phrynosoma platyrhinos TaxID=52577 RepID=A0ABQ7SDL7_PHRPL|nr:hypothetical protein JD844_004629 [Phrynosoma platyrhinos]